MRRFREAGMSLRDCASYFQVSLATTMRALAEMREKFGPEALPRDRKHLARATVATSQNVSGETNSR